MLSIQPSIRTEIRVKHPVEKTASQRGQVVMERRGIRMPMSRLRRYPPVHNVPFRKDVGVPLEDDPSRDSQSNLNGEKEHRVVREQPVAHSIGPRTDKNWSMMGLRQSISDLNITSRVKSVVGRKRAREEDEDDLEREQPVRKAPALVGVFWQRYRDLHVYHNEFEALVAATVVSHTYDEANGLQMLRDPPYVNEGALAALEGEPRPSSSGATSSFDWSEHVEDIRCRLGLRPEDPPVLAASYQDEDLSWAGDEVDDFRCFVRVAESSTWDARMSESSTVEEDGASALAN